MALADKRAGLHQVLVESGLLSVDQLARALDEQERTGDFLGAILTRQNLLSETQWVPVLAEHLGLPSIRLRDADVSREALARVPAKFATHYALLPVRFDGGVLEIAVADPFNVQTLDEVRLLIGCDV